MKRNEVSRAEVCRRKRTTIRKLLEYVEEYPGPTEGIVEQDAFFASFLTDHPIQRTTTQNGRSFVGAYHTVATFIAMLKETLHRSPKGMDAAMNFFFRLKASAFRPRYIIKCEQADSSTSGAISGTDSSEIVPEPCRGSPASDPVQPFLQGQPQPHVPRVQVPANNLSQSASFEMVADGTSSEMQIDLRFIEGTMKSAERTYTHFGAYLADHWNKQSLFPSAPSKRLGCLYQTAFGSKWRRAVAWLREQHMAENSDVLYSLTGAALYQEVYMITSGPERQDTWLFPSKLVLDRLKLFSDLEIKSVSEDLGWQLAEALREHMKCQDAAAASQFTTAATDLDARLSRIFEGALTLKRNICASEEDIRFGWFIPGEPFEFEAMSLDQWHTSPPGLCKVAMCFLPYVEDGSRKGVDSLYQAVVKGSRHETTPAESFIRTFRWLPCAEDGVECSAEVMRI